MDLQLTGKRALITGGSNGIGRASATVLAEEGCDVVLVARVPANLENAATSIRAASPRRHATRVGTTIAPHRCSVRLTGTPHSALPPI